MQESKAVSVGSLDVRPRLDTYHTHDFWPTLSVLKVNPKERSVVMVQEEDDGVTLSDEWYHLIIRIGVTRYPDEQLLRGYLESGLGQQHLRKLCDGWSLVSDGNIMVGDLTEDAHQARVDIMLDVDYEMEDYWEFWNTPEWFGDWLFQMEHEGTLKGTTTDSALGKIADEMEKQMARDSPNIVLATPILDCLVEYRDQLFDGGDTGNDPR